MKKKVAILVDFSFFLNKKPKTKVISSGDYIKQFFEYLDTKIKEDEEVFRIFIYDSLPEEHLAENPISKQKVDYIVNNGWRGSLLKKFARENNVAFRKGALSFKGFAIAKSKVQDIIEANRSLEAGDLHLSVEQKQVDLKIGLDVAWLSSKNIVDKILLISGDSDFIPAMKHARREGLQVLLDYMGNRIKSELLEHVDEVR